MTTTRSTAPHTSPLPPLHSDTRLFFALALGGTWLLQLPAVLVHVGVVPGDVDHVMVPAALGGFAPLVAAVVASRREGGRAAVRALFARLRTPRVSLAWLALALLGFAGLHVVTGAVVRVCGGTDAGPWLYLPTNAQQVAALVLVPLAEEPAWRGYALPRLQMRLSPLRASVVLGVCWAAWHALMFVLQGATASTFALLMLNIVAGTFVFTWLWSRTGGSLLAAVVAHMGAHLDNPAHALPDHPAHFAWFTAGLVAAACALVVADRRAWRTQVQPAGGVSLQEP
jgi:membrane protease YdiL (CAAX protease family)